MKGQDSAGSLSGSPAPPLLDTVLGLDLGLSVLRLSLMYTGCEINCLKGRGWSTVSSFPGHFLPPIAVSLPPNEVLDKA